MSFSLDIAEEYNHSRTTFNQKALDWVKQYGLPRQ